MIDDLTINLIATEGRNITRRYADDPEEYGIFNLAALANPLAQLNAELRKAQPAVATLKAAGAVLFDELLGHQLFRAYTRRSMDRGHTLRLRIHSDQPALMAIPWEYLYDRESDQWLVLRPDLSLVRGLPLPRYEPQPVTGPLRVLVMVADPKDLPRLNSRQELAGLEQVEATGMIEVLPVASTYAALQTALRQQHPHVFHFIGHGTFPNAQSGRAAGVRHLQLIPDTTEPSAESQGMLAFCTPDGEADLIEADRLAPLLAGCETLELVLLNACEGAVTGEQSAFAGLTQRLIQQQLPAVIAMQAPIVDDHAVRFSQEFYAALADGYGIEQAVGEGRKAILAAAYTWGIPTFYLQASQPFAIPQLTDAEKADRLWQKAQTFADSNQCRGALARVLQLNPAHTGARAAQERLAHEEEADQLYATVDTYYQDEQWQEAHCALEKIEQIVPNFRNTRLRLAEVLGKLSDVTPTTPLSYDTKHAQYRPIRNALLEGRLVPFLGWDVSRFGRPAHTGWGQGHYLPVAEEAAEELAKHLPEELAKHLPEELTKHLPKELKIPQSLLQISQYTALLDGKTALYKRLSALYTDGYQPTMLHHLLAELPKRLRAKGYPTNPDHRYVFFSTAFDDLLERAFVKMKQPYHLFAYRHNYRDADGVLQPGRFVHIPPAGEAVEVLTPNSYHAHDADGHPVIVKLCGRHITAEPDSVLVTEDQYLEYLPAQEIGTLLPMTLLDQVKHCSFLFMGYSLQPWHFRLLWQRMHYQKSRLDDRSWAIVPMLTEIDLGFWRSQDIVPIVSAPEDVVAYISEWLKTLEVRE